jgi:hypothetical protein
MVAVRVLSPEEEAAAAADPATGDDPLRQSGSALTPARPPTITPTQISGKPSVVPPPRRMTGARPGLASRPLGLTPVPGPTEFQPTPSPVFGIPATRTGAVLLTRRTALFGIVGGGFLVALVAGLVFLWLNPSPETSSEAAARDPDARAAASLDEPDAAAQPDAEAQTPGAIALATSAKLAPDATTARDPLDAAVDAATPPDAVAGAPAQAAEATITLAGLPPDARITIDGALVGSEFRLPISDKPYELQVLAAGRRPFVQPLRVTGNTTIFVTLLRGPTTVRPHDAGTVAVPPPVPDAGPPRTDTGFAGNPFASNPFENP